MKTLYSLLLVVSVSSNAFAQANLQELADSAHVVTHQSSADNEIGIAQYPNAKFLPEAAERLIKEKASTWLTARVYHSDDAIKDVNDYFKALAKRAKRPDEVDPLLKSLLRDNWKLGNDELRHVPTIFGTGKELRTPQSVENIQTSFGIILIQDSNVRVHLMSPHPSSANINQLTAGTMIIQIRERLTHAAKGASPDQSGEDEKVYSGRDVTSRARVKSKPKPDAVPGIYGVVVLRVVFSSSGQVTQIKVVSALPGGQTEAAIKAAQKIKFEPAIKDGRYVSSHVQLEYAFHP